MASLIDKLKHGWNAFNENESIEFRPGTINYGESYGVRPDRRRVSFANERSIVTAILAHIAMDAAAIDMFHVTVDENGRFTEQRKSGLNNCLTVEANIDQAARHFRQDMVMSMFEQGVIAIVPVDTTLNPLTTGGYDVNTMRIGEIVAWYPRHVRVRVYNDVLGKKQEIRLPKEAVAIIENPMYSIMNEPNSTLQRLIRKLNMLDAVDEASSSGKLDLIIQLPYVIKTEARQHQADQRRDQIESQLKGSKYGIAYTDGTEKITQLNRPAENNMLAQVQYLTTMLYGQLGLTEAVFNGTADEAAMLNYYNRTIEPILAALTEGLKRSFLTKTARTQGQSVEVYRDPFKLVSVKDFAEIADKLTRNEILSSNEVRGLIGFKPSDDPEADKLKNSNVPQPTDGSVSTDPAAADASAPTDTSEQDQLVEDTFASLEAEIDKIMGETEEE